MSALADTIRIETETRWTRRPGAPAGGHHTYSCSWVTGGQCGHRADDADLELGPRAAAESWAAERRLEATLRRGTDTYELP